MRNEFLVFGAPAIGDEEVQEVVQCLRSGWLGTGPRVAQFEKDFANYKGVQNAVALNSCTAGLHLSLCALDLRPGDEVITSPMTFCATVNSIIHAGGNPVLADVDPVTQNMMPESVAAAVTPRTKAILPVHFAGRPCDMDSLSRIASDNDVRIVEDCAHAIEAEYHGRKIGTIGEFGCFSFYSTKNVVTGEGGMVLAQREEDAIRLRIMGLHGMSRDAWKRFGGEGYKHYDVVACGFKYNMMDLQAAIGIPQLRRVEANWARRRAIWSRYSEELMDLPLRLPASPESDTKHGYHLYTVLVDSARCGICRDEFVNEMTRRKIGVGVHYRSIADHPYYRDALGMDPGAYPNALSIGRQTVSLPLSPKLTDSDVVDVIQAVREILV